jgi:S-adenosyl methyltransferase
MNTESIIDTTRPSAGRIYDYLLGGHHNFEVDRQAAEQVVKLIPYLPKVMRLQRWCLQDLAVELTEKRGFDIIIDFASGLPTNDHLHYVVPKGTTVIYSDFDPVVVEYAREILADTPDVYFFLADARRPEELLNRAEVEAILGGRRQVGLVYWGISGFLTDEEISYAARSLYNWSGAGSCWAFNAQAGDTDGNDSRTIAAREIYARMGSSFYFRSLDETLQLLQPWHPDENGPISLREWHGLDQREMSQQDLDSSNPEGGGYGIYLVK